MSNENWICFIDYQSKFSIPQTKYSITHRHHPDIYYRIYFIIVQNIKFTTEIEYIAKVSICVHQGINILWVYLTPRLNSNASAILWASFHTNKSILMFCSHPMEHYVDFIRGGSKLHAHISVFNCRFVTKRCDT